MHISTQIINSPNSRFIERVARMRLCETDEFKSNKEPYLAHKRAQKILDTILQPLLNAESGGTTFILAYNNNFNLGYIQGRKSIYSEDLYFSSGMFIHPDFRHYGVDKYLIDEQCKFAKNIGYGGIITITSEENNIAKQLLQYKNQTLKNISHDNLGAVVYFFNN